MNKTLLLAVCALSALALSSCTETPTPTPAQPLAATSSTPTVASTPTSNAEGVQLVATSRLDGEKIATYTFHGKGEVECAGKTMLQLDFRIEADPDSHFAPNYDIGEWTGYVNGIEVEKSPVTIDAAKCLPAKYHGASINPGDSAEIVVLLDVEGLDEIGYKDHSFAKPLILSL